MKYKVTVQLVILDQASRLLLCEDSGVYRLPSEALNGNQPDEVAANILARYLGAAEATTPKLDKALLVRGDPVMSELNLVFNTNYTQSGGGEVAQNSSTQWVDPHKLQRQQLSLATRCILFDEIMQEHQSDEDNNMQENNIQNTTVIQPGATLTIHTDGGSRGNPGPSAAAFVILDEQGRVIFKEGKYLGITTNNQAEYQAVKMALEKGAACEAKVVNFKMDSLLVVNQMSGIYKIKNKDLWPIYTAIQDLRKRFQSVTFTHVPRELNREADALVNEVLDAQ